jgi:hypothetical protein
MASSANGYPSFENDGQMVQGGGPVRNGPGPPFTGFHDGQVQHLPYRVGGRKSTPVLGDLPELGIDRFHGIRGVDTLPDLPRIVEERRVVRPVGPPNPAGLGESAFPPGTETLQFLPSRLERWCPVDGLQVPGYSPAFLPGYIAQGATDQVHNAQLDLGLGENRLNARRKPRGVRRTPDGFAGS